MLFSYNWLQDYIKEKLLKPRELAELLTIHFAEVKELHAVRCFLSENLKKATEDWVLDIDIKPNRAGDCFSHLGIAREIAAITGFRFQVSGFKLKEDKNIKAQDFITIEVKDHNACPRFTIRVITDVKVGPSPKWLQERLKVCGLRPINNIVDITNYAMLETGQPLHAYDGEKLKSKKLIIRFAKKGEKITTLDNQKFNLDKDVLTITDQKDPVCIAGIKGGIIPEIDKKTKIVVLEGANWAQNVIRRGSQKLNLKTDASLRFEHGVPLPFTELGVNRATNLIQEIAKGKVAQGLIDVYPKKASPKKIKLKLDYVEKLLGLKIPKTEIIKILRSLGFVVGRVGRATSDILEVQVPEFRLDVSIPEDLIEEIGRIAGYEKIPVVFPTVSLIPPERNDDIFWENKVKDILKEAGMSEVYNYSFLSEDRIKNFSFNEKKLLEIENPLSREYNYLRPSLLPNLLKNVKDNFRFFDEMKIFELGKIYKRQGTRNKEQGTIEKRMLTGIIARKESREDGLSEIKGIIDLLLEKLGIADVWYDSFEPTPEEEGKFWHPQKCGEIKVGDEEIGFFGEIESPEISGQVLAFDVDFEKLQKLAIEEQEYTPVSPFPAAIRDLAVLVPTEVKVIEVLNRIETAGGILVRDVDLFDLYEGEEIPEGKKNLAFHIIYQAEDRTLTSGEIDNIHNKIANALEKVGWEVRK